MVRTITLIQTAYLSEYSLRLYVCLFVIIILGIIYHGKNERVIRIAYDRTIIQFVHVQYSIIDNDPQQQILPSKYN